MGQVQQLAAHVATDGRDRGGDWRCWWHGEERQQSSLLSRVTACIWIRYEIINF